MATVREKQGTCLFAVLASRSGRDEGVLMIKRRKVALAVGATFLLLIGPPGVGGASPKQAAETALAFPPLEPSARVDPANDGWDTEVLSAQVEEQLARIAAWIQNPDAAADEAEEFVDEGFRSRSFHPQELEERFREGLLTVRHAADGRDTQGTAERLGAAGFNDALRGLAQRFEGWSAQRADFKLFRIERDEQSFSTQAYFEASARSEDAARQINAVWTCRWRYADPQPSSAKPRLLGVEVSDYEEAETRLRGGTLFHDVTTSALGHNTSYREHLLQAPEHWLSRLTKAGGFIKDGWQGISVADVNGDGLEDLFLPQQGGLPNRLFVQNRDGTFDDRSAESGVDFLERTLAGLFVDLDNDGDRDLVLALRPAVLVLENDGRGGFARIRFVAGAVTDSHSLSAVDYDSDGDLDLYVCVYRRAPHGRGLTSPVPYHDANNGGRNVLLRNEGGFRFTDVTVETGLDTNNRRFSLAAAWEDFDNDGDADLYVANDYGRNNLYRNDGVGGDGHVHFSDIAATAGVEDISSGMSVSWADYDRDGLMDLYVGNMFSAAGNRISYQRKFDRERERAGPLGDLQRMARGNSLFRNAGDGSGFLDRSEAAAVTMGRWSWSSVFADLNNDGWEDLVVANGNLTQANPDDL